MTFRQCFREHSLGQHELQDCVFEENSSSDYMLVTCGLLTVSSSYTTVYTMPSIIT